MLQALLSLFDAGMSQALVRAVAVRIGDSSFDRNRAADLLLGFERLYWGFALIVGGLILTLSNSIAAHWLVMDEAYRQQGELAVRGAAIIFILQFPGSVYRSVLVGTQDQVRLNGVLAAGAVIRHGGGAVVVSMWTDLSTYLLWQALTAGLETWVRATLAWRALASNRRSSRWDSTQMHDLWKVVAGMSAATWLGALTVQMDKIWVSKMVSIEQFGYYSIAATVAAGLLQLVYPVMQAALPRAVQLRADAVALRRLSVRLFGVAGLLVVGGGLGYAVLGEWVLQVWLKSPSAVTAVHPVLSLLLVGTALNALYNVGYIHWVVHEKTHRVLQVNAMALLLSVIVIPPMVASHGTIGAAFGWLAINLLGFVLSLEWVKK